MSIINWIKYVGGAMTCLAIEEIIKEKGGPKKRWSICGQYTNVCKLGANWDHQDFGKKTMQVNQNNFNILIMTFFNFYVVETFSKINFLFQILHSSKL